MLVKSGNTKILRSQKIRIRFKLRSLVFFPQPWKVTLLLYLAVNEKFLLKKRTKITLCFSYSMFRNYFARAPMASHLIVGGVP